MEPQSLWKIQGLFSYFVTMKRRIPFYHIICFAVVAISLFLPYASHDEYTGGWFSGNRQLITDDLMKSGFDYLEVTFVPPVAILVISTILLAARNRATAIVGLVLSFFLMLWLPIMLFVLTFNLFGSDDRVQIGFILCVLSVLTYFGFNIGNLVYTVRQYRSGADRKPNSALLDDSDLLDTL